MQVDLTSDERRKFVLEVHQCEPRNIPGLKLNQDVDIAVRSEVIAQDRAKESESPDVMAAAEVSEALPNVPIIGMGGVLTGRDALELILAGASMVSVGTAIFHDPSACARILRELDEELARRGTERVTELVGAAHDVRAAGRRT